MLSRVADSLYWMNRYVERAENVARIVDVNQQLLLDVPAKQASRIARSWLPLVACLGDEEAFQKQHKKTDAAAAIEFLVFDRSHPSSISGSLCAARENARTVREEISQEMWEQLNRAYLWITSKSARQSFDSNHYEFFQRVQKTLLLFQGITEAFMQHGEGWEFMQIGKYLERADKTSRLLDDDFHLLGNKDLTAADQLLQWVTVLRCANARQTYQQLYEAGVQKRKVADLLLLNDGFPRSVNFCVRNVDLALRKISGTSEGRFANPAEKLSGRLLAELSFSSVEDFLGRGLHAAMDDLQTKLNAIGAAVLAAYIHQELPPETAQAVQSETPQ